MTAMTSTMTFTRKMTTLDGNETLHTYEGPLDIDEVAAQIEKLATDIGQAIGGTSQY